MGLNPAARASCRCRPSKVTKFRNPSSSAVATWSTSRVRQPTAGVWARLIWLARLSVARQSTSVSTYRPSARSSSNDAIASLNASALMIFRNDARQMPFTTSKRPWSVIGNAPFVRPLQTLMAADAGSWMYSFSRALGSTYVRSAFGTVCVVKGLCRGGADRTRLATAQALQVVLGRRGLLPASRRIRRQAISDSPPLGDQNLSLLLKQLLDLRKFIAQIADRRGYGHPVRQVCLTAVRPSTSVKFRLVARIGRKI